MDVPSTSMSQVVLWIKYSEPTKITYMLLLTLVFSLLVTEKAYFSLKFDHTSPCLISRKMYEYIIISSIQING